MKVKFVCPKCGNNILHKITIDIIEKIEKDNARHSTTMETTKYIFRYACYNCDFIIQHVSEHHVSYIISEYELYDWLQENDMLKKE